MKSFKTVKEAQQLLGKKVKVIGNSCSHGYIIGSIVTITKIMDVNSFCADNSTSYIVSNDIEMTPITKAEIITRLEELEKTYKAEKEELELKHKFLIESGSDEFDENEYKAFKTLQIIEKTKLSKYEKAKLIANLLKQ